MAREPKGSAKSGAKKAAPRKTPEQKIIAAALKLAEDHDWTDLKLSQIAKVAKVPLKELTHLYSSKTAILVAFMDQVDEQTMDNIDPELEEEPARDRLLDVLITRFEVLAAHKAALKRIRATLARDPLVLANINRALVRSMERMMAAASCEAGGMRGLARAQGLAFVYQAAMDVWLEDDDPGMARTMAELDGRLRRGERNLKRVNMALNVARGAVGVCKSLRKQARERRQNPPADEAVTA